MSMRVLVVGAGLIGGSVALALKSAGYEVSISDLDRDIQDAARSFLKISQNIENPDAVVVAVPPSAVSKVILDSNRSFPNATLIDVASIMNKPISEVEAKSLKISNWIPSHPMAGKESGGFKNSSYDLFQDRLWVISPQIETSAGHIDRAKQIITDCGALLLEMEGAAHDATVAVTSHLPQVLATLLAKQLNDLPVESLKVSGQGLKDLTRIASSCGLVWREILVANKSNVEQSILKVVSDLQALKKALEEENLEAISSFFDLGNKGKEKIPGKHGGRQEIFEIVSIEIDDKPGQLAGIFTTAGKANVNIEDVRIDHALGKEIAIIELSVDPKQKEQLMEALILDGWKLRASISQE